MIDLFPHNPFYVATTDVAIHVLRIYMNHSERVTIGIVITEGDIFYE